MSTKDEDGPRPEDREDAGGGLRHSVAAYERRQDEAARLAARVRHEINNPLTGLMGQAQLLLREELSETARRRVHVIEQLAGRIRDAAAELRALEIPGGVEREADGGVGETKDDPPRH